MNFSLKFVPDNEHTWVTHMVSKRLEFWTYGRSISNKIKKKKKKIWLTYPMFSGDETGNTHIFFFFFCRSKLNYRQLLGKANSCTVYTIEINQTGTIYRLLRIYFPLPSIKWPVNECPISFVLPLIDVTVRTDEKYGNNLPQRQTESSFRYIRNALVFSYWYDNRAIVVVVYIVAATWGTPLLLKE